MKLPRKILPIALAPFALFVMTNAGAWAWSMGGHRVTGVIAARQLAAGAPQVAAAIANIMQEHPAAGAFVARLDDAGSEPQLRLERLFAEIAQWPDEVRSGPFKNFHHGDWHTIDMPYLAPGFQPPRAPQIAEDNLLTALRENARIAGDGSAPAAERAVALCWVFHLIGDLHQPLHTASLYNTAYPDGDRHGTQFFVRLPHGGDAVSLHYFWDSAVQRSQNMAEVTRTASLLLQNHAAATLDELLLRPYRSSDSFARWVQEESRPLAISAAYRDGGLAGAPERRNAAPLSEDYAAHARTIGARRMALSGYRLAEVLQALFR